MRLIDADALKEELMNRLRHIYDSDQAYGMSCAIDAIDEAPTIKDVKDE